MKIVSVRTATATKMRNIRSSNFRCMKMLSTRTVLIEAIASAVMMTQRPEVDAGERHGDARQRDQPEPDQQVLSVARRCACRLRDDGRAMAAPQCKR